MIKPKKRATVEELLGNKKCPSILKELMAKYGNNFQDAANAANVKDVTLRNVAKGLKLSAQTKERIEAAIKGDAPPPMRHTGGTGGPIVLAVVIAPVATFEKLYDVWQAMKQEWRFKRKAGSTWIGVVAAPKRDVAALAAIAKAYNAEVIEAV
jgi:hypothetical protein